MQDEVEVVYSELPPHQLTSSAATTHFQEADALTSGAAPSKFMRQFRQLSHQPIYRGTSQQDNAGDDMSTPPPHPPSPSLLISPPSPATFTVPPDHTHRQWFEDSLPDLVYENNSSTHDDEDITTSFLPPPAMTSDCREDPTDTRAPASGGLGPLLNLTSKVDPDPRPHAQTVQQECSVLQEDPDNSHVHTSSMSKSGTEPRYCNINEEMEMYLMERVKTISDRDCSERAAKEQPSLGRKVADPLWYQTSSMMDNLEKVKEDKQEDIMEHTLQVHDNVYVRMQLQEKDTQNHIQQQCIVSDDHPCVSECTTQLSYEIATSATPSTSQVSFDLLSGRPLRPTQEWWATSPSPPPVGQEGAHTTDHTLMAGIPPTWSEEEWLEREKKRYKRIQVGNVPSDSVKYHQEDACQPVYINVPDVVPDVVPLHPKTPHCSSVKVQSSQQCLEGDVALPRLDTNPVYHTHSEAMHMITEARHGKGTDKESHQHLTKQVTRYQFTHSLMTTLIATYMHECVCTSVRWFFLI